MSEYQGDQLNSTTIEGPGDTQATHSARTGPRATRDRMLQRVSTVSDDIQRRRQDIEREIQEHPIRTIAIALGAGYLLARILD
jgi:hypothetical protein